MRNEKPSSEKRGEMHRIFLAGVASLALVFNTAHAEKKPEVTAVKKVAPVSVSTASYQAKRIKDKKTGKVITKWVRARRVVPGTVVRYIDTVTNRTDKPLKNVAIKNPINPHLTYVAQTAKCATGCRIYYSVDGGKHFDVPKRLFVKDPQTGKKRLANPKEYNAVKWVIAEVPAESNTTVEFKAKLK